MPIKEKNTSTAAINNLSFILTASMEPPADKSELMTAGFLSSLLGAGCECDGYNIEIVGHSLGGAVAALLGIRVS